MPRRYEKKVLLIGNLQIESATQILSSEYPAYSLNLQPHGFFLTLSQDYAPVLAIELSSDDHDVSIDVHGSHATTGKPEIVTIKTGQRFIVFFGQNTTVHFKDIIDHSWDLYVFTVNDKPAATLQRTR